MMNLELIEKWMKHTIKKRNLKGTQLSEMSGISQATISGWLRWDKNLSCNYLNRIINALGFKLTIKVEKLK